MHCTTLLACQLFKIKMSFNHFYININPNPYLKRLQDPRGIVNILNEKRKLNQYGEFFKTATGFLTYY